MRGPPPRPPDATKAPAAAGVSGAAAPAPIVMEAGLELEEAPGAARRPLLKLRVPSPVPGWLAKLLDAVPGARRLAASSPI